MKPQDKMLLSLFEQYNKRSITFDTIFTTLNPLGNPMVRFANITYLWTLQEMYNTIYSSAPKEDKELLQDHIDQAINKQQIELL